MQLNIKDELITIVVPVHNPGSYLTACLDSILLQTFKNLEIILVDDDSIDGSREIISKYAQQDRRFKSFRVKNHNAALTRKYGIEHASGEYVCFIDSDDIVRQDYVQVLYEAISGSGLDIAVAKLQVINDDTKLAEENTTVRPRSTIVNDTLTYFCDNYRLSEDGGYVAQTMCAKMFLRQSIENLDYSVIKTSVLEDNYIVSQILYGLKQQKIVMVDAVVYFYRQHQNSTMSDVLTHPIAYGNGLITYPQLFEHIAEYIKKKYEGHIRLNELVNKLKAQEYYGVAESLTGRLYLLIDQNKQIEYQNQRILHENSRLQKLIEDKTGLVGDVLNSKTYKVGSTVVKPLKVARRIIKGKYS